MSAEIDESHISKLEAALIVGVIGCLLLATWELGHLAADEWLRDWVQKNDFTNRRIILYGIAFSMAFLSLALTTAFTPRSGRFGYAVSRAFLWYGVLLLISTIAIFVFDCLPEVFAGFVGAGVFIGAIYFLQRRFFSPQRVAMSRLSKGQCVKCGSGLQASALFCAGCGNVTGKKCSHCNSYVKIGDKFCSSCGGPEIEPQAV
jgi:hypothetical protein